VVLESAEENEAGQIFCDFYSKGLSQNPIALLKSQIANSRLQIKKEFEI
jgi:hypothetical protein